SIEDLGQKLSEKKPTLQHVGPLEALKMAKEKFTADVAPAQGQRVVHFVGDFRDVDWVSGPDSDKVAQVVDEMLENKINVVFFDASHPPRKGSDMAVNHDNLAIVDLRAETRVAAEGVPVEFTLRVHNYGTTERRSFLRTRVDGQLDFQAVQPLEGIPPNGF